MDSREFWPQNDPPADGTAKPSGDDPGSGQTESPDPPERLATAGHRAANESHAEAPRAATTYVVPLSSPEAESNGRPKGGVAVRPRRKVLPAVLFVLTALSTFWVGCSIVPFVYILEAIEQGSSIPLRRPIVSNWQDGLIYMGSLLAILAAHEMGHFVFTLVHRIPSSLPFFLPLPITPIGTLGAVIGMDGRHADRRQTFDIGIAGPLAGLVVAVPVMWMGVQQLDLFQPTGRGGIRLGLPLLTNLMMHVASPEGWSGQASVWLGQLRGNPWFMAGWFGLLLTGVNMLPVSQLDGGHVVYCLFGRHARWVSRAFMLAAAVFILWKAPFWILMALIVLLIGVDHPPTRDDTVRLGWFRTLLGYLSLAIPILCFAPLAFST